ncbi:MAG: beta-lactamase family protein [Bacteroidales bacterium]|nr:beta-lactamase family protein [Bacteroidales bacterium]MBN2821027.1 beta-lactamase family protein [Bacteroidales bacterium]
MKRHYINTILFIVLFGFTSFNGKFGYNLPVDLYSVINKLPDYHSETIDAYKSYLFSELDSSKTVGAAVAIISHDSVLLMEPYGFRKFGESGKVDIHTVFRLASVSKGFAGVLGLIAEQDSIFNLEQPVKYFLPGFQLKDSVNTCNMNIRHTLNHTSGIIPHAYDNLVEADIPMSEIINRLVEVDISARPGEVYAYQNAVFSLIDTILKVQTGEGYNFHVKKNIFTPLGMKDATLSFEGLTGDSNFAFPHTPVSGGYSPLKLNSGYYNVSPAAGVNASISDMSKWLKALLGYEQNVLNSELLQQIATPSVYTPLKRRYTYHWGKVDDRHYSLGWRIYKYLGYDIVYHGGYVQGYKAEIAFCPELKTGIVFLENSPNSIASRCIPEFWQRYFALIDSLKENS